MKHGRGADQFDHRAYGYEHGWRGEFHARLVEASADLAMTVRPDAGSVLDVGCGTGALLRALRGRLTAASELRGVDPAPAMVEVARAQVPAAASIRIEEGRAERLPFAAASFDLVVSTVSFHHWDDRAAGLAEVARVLRPGGRLVLVDHFSDGWLRAFDAIVRRGMMRGREVESLLARAGLTLLRWARVYDLGPLPLIRAAVAAKPSSRP